MQFPEVAVAVISRFIFLDNIDWLDAIITLDSISSGNYYDKACLLARMDRLYEALNAWRDAQKRGVS